MQHVAKRCWLKNTFFPFRADLWVMDGNPRVTLRLPWAMSRLPFQGANTCGYGCYGLLPFQGEFVGDMVETIPNEQALNFYYEKKFC